VISTTLRGLKKPVDRVGDRPPWKDGLAGPDIFCPALLEPVLAIHAGALVHVGFGDVGAPARGYAILDALADKTPHQEGAALDAPVGLGVPGDPLFVSQRILFRKSARTRILPQQMREAVIGSYEGSPQAHRSAAPGTASLIRTADCSIIGTQQVCLVGWEDMSDVA
jgi:hypothetical protein